MPYSRRDFAGASTRTSLTADVVAGGTTLTIADPTGWPDGTNGKFLVVVDPETVAEEKFYALSRSGPTVLVADAGDRGADGTAPSAHSAGATIYHCHGAVDDDESNYAVSETVGRIAVADDLLVGSGPNAFRTLNVGGDGTVLRVSGATVGWGALGAGSLATDSVTADEIAAAAVGTAELAPGAVTTAKLADGAVTRAKLEATAQLPIGAVTDYAGPTPPVGWLLCDGNQYLRATYTLLDAVIATTYGSYTDGAGAAGTTHFRTPDLRGRMAVAPDNMGGTDAARLAATNILGGTGGAETHALTIAELPNHNHGMYGAVVLSNQGGITGVNNMGVITAPNTAHEGGNGAHNNMPPYCMLNKIIYAGQ